MNTLNILDRGGSYPRQNEGERKDFIKCIIMKTYALLVSGIFYVLFWGFGW